MVSQEKKDRLWNCLLELEKQTGGKLRLTPRYYPTKCPISNFAPIKDGYGRDYNYTDFHSVGYISPNRELKIKEYYVHTYEDSDWWFGLSARSCKEVTNWVIKKLKERESCKQK